ncbi:hypothetical protein [Mucilaginibacter celer]|uniref:Uncharacterized protein n=1 Tax=Mucilaginibacter celer TaxID=2305508 RepID=A0A494VRX9_9SPHI|nr:hypothetical protein [Mucilaginibacter celer]AYL96150.1 hypothetical protein HYN43_012990 [Mucilaginibacter celer]
MDLLISLNQEKLNQAIAKLHSDSKIHASLFVGSKKGSFEKVDFQVDWDVTASPQIDFRPPTINEWISSIKSDGGRAIPLDNAFIVFLPALAITFFDGVDTRRTEFPLTIIGRIPNNNQGALLTAEAVVIDLSRLSDLDSYVAREEFIPEIIDQVNKAISGLQIPAPSFEGVMLTPPRAGISNKNLVVAFNLIDRGQPDVSHVFVPDKPFVVMASQDLMRIAANYMVTTQIQGQTFRLDDRVGGSGFNAHYSVEAHIDYMHVEPAGNPTIFRTMAGMRAFAQAGVTIDVPYDPTKW